MVVRLRLGFGDLGCGGWAPGIRPADTAGSPAPLRGGVPFTSCNAIVRVEALEPLLQPVAVGGLGGEVDCLRVVDDGLVHQDRRPCAQRQGDGVARPRIDDHALALHREMDDGEEGVLLEVGDDDAIHVPVEVRDDVPQSVGSSDAAWRCPMEGDGLDSKMPPRSAAPSPLALRIRWQLVWIHHALDVISSSWLLSARGDDARSPQDVRPAPRMGRQGPDPPSGPPVAPPGMGKLNICRSSAKISARAAG